MRQSKGFSAFRYTHPPRSGAGRCSNLRSRGTQAAARAPLGTKGAA